MRVVGGLLLVALGAAAALLADRVLLEPASSDATTPAVPQSAPGPGDPPVVWVDGTLEEVSDSQIIVREGQGPEVAVERLGQGATAFLALEGSEWLELADEQISEIETGGLACVETLLDGRTFLALRVFLGSGCGPA
ncbi:MAG: hypothetical protein ACRDH8_07130 [Actinomycetota bacterium]